MSPKKKSRYDWVDLRFPETEPAGVFIMTKLVTQKEQKVGKCVDFDQPCPCREKAECVDLTWTSRA